MKVESLASDKRVQFPQQFAPSSEPLARAVADFATALAKGDDAGLAKMLDAPARGLLAMQVRSGEWKDATANIQAVRVVRLNPTGDGAEVGLAIQDGGSSGAYLTGWRAKQMEGAILFTGMPVVARSAPKASDLDNADLAPPVTKKEEPKTAAKPAAGEPTPTEAAPASPGGLGPKPADKPKPGDKPKAPSP